MLISRFYPIIGGSEGSLLGLSKKLLKWDVNLFVLTERWRSEHRVCDVIEGVPVYRLSLVRPNWLRGISHVFLVFVFLFWKTRQYDLIHTYSNVALGSVGTLVGKLLGKRVVCNIATGGKILRLRKRALGRILIAILGRADAVVALSNEIKNELDTVGISDAKVRLIPNGADTSLYRPLSPEEKQRKKRQLKVSHHLIVLFVGRLVYRKGVDVLLKAWKRIAPDHPEMHLYIAGSGFLQPDSNEHELKEYVTENHLEKSVTFLGNIRNVHEFLQVADIFVMPSRQEGMPNVLLQAMSSSLPVIATNIGGVTDLVSNDVDGIICPVDDPKALAEKILDLKEDSEFAKTLGENARRSVEEKYSWERNHRGYVKVYLDVSG
jgi:glycosyltransferase involved in cell wall biosynthesis